MPITASSVAARWDSLYEFLIWMSIVFFLIVVGGMFYFIFKYPRTKSQKPEYITHNNVLEAVYIAIPTVLLMGIFVWGYSVYRDMVNAPSNAMEVRAIGKQWLWQFQYANGRSTVNELYVPLNRPVKMILSSDDVLHGFFIPNFRVKSDVVPGMYTSVWFEAKVPGKHHIFCTAYCGTSHSGMIAKLIVLTPEQWTQWEAGKKIQLAEIPDSRDWVKQQDVAAREAQPQVGEGVANAGFVRQTLAQQGRGVFEQKGCVACHAGGDLTGATGSMRAGLVSGHKIGPALKGLYGTDRPLVDGKVAKVDDNYLRESIEYPNAKLAQGYSGVMPTFKGLLSETELNAVITYIKELK